MVTPRKLAKRRAARKARADNLRNAMGGGQPQQQGGGAPGGAPRPGQPGKPGNPDDPDGLVMGGGARVRVVSSEGVDPIRQGAKKVTRPGQAKITQGPVRSNRGGVQVRQSGVRQTNIGGRSQGGNPAPALQPQAPQGIAPVPGPNEVRQAEQAVADLTVVLTCFERPQFFRRQLEALKAQTVQPNNLVVWCNTGNVAHDDQALAGANMSIIRSNVNMGPWVRFTLSAEMPTKYICVLDDDTIPGPRWFAECIQRLEEAEASEEGTYCIAASGEVFRSDNYDDRMGVGKERQGPEEVEVDIGRQGWFFHRDLARLFINHPRGGNGRIGWDLHFAAACQKAEVLTLVLPYDFGNKSAWGMLEDAATEKSISSVIDAEHNSGGDSLRKHQADLYMAYRQLDWAPLVVLDQEDPEAPDAEAAG